MVHARPAQPLSAFKAHWIHLSRIGLASRVVSYVLQDGSRGQAAALFAAGFGDIV